MTHEEIEKLLLTAEEDNKHGNFANSEKTAREVLQHLEGNKTSAREALHIRALLALSESLGRRSMAIEALAFAEQALAESIDSSSPGRRELEAKALNIIGLMYGDLTQYTNALEYHKKALALDQELGNKIGVARHIGNIGLVYVQLAEYAKALEYYEKALALDEEFGNKAAVARHTGNIGVVYYKLSEYAKALEYYEKALALNEEFGNKVESARTTGNIGIVYYQLSQYSKAIEYFEKALDNSKELGNKADIARHTGDIGAVYSTISEYAKALDYLEKALNLSRDIRDRREIGCRLSGIGDTLRKLGRKKEALEFLQQALRLRREEIQSNEDVAWNLTTIGLLLAEENQFDEAIEKLEEALALAEQLGEKNNASEAHKELASVYEKIGDTAKAFEHTKKYYALKEEIFSDDTRKRVEAFNFRVATANKERDLKLARLEKEQAEQSLRMKERELANTASSLAAQTELLGDFRADLRKIVMRPDKVSTEDIIRQVRVKLKELPCEMIDFGKFEAQFATVHPEFRAKLEATYPDLTPQEIKICMLMHVNLQTAAIARLTCLSERTVENHRFNIRKKMGLGRDDNLLDVLRKLDGKTTPQPPPTP